MKKLFIVTLAIPMLFACATERKSIAQINAERNSAQAYMTTASYEQQKMQRLNELEESILIRQQNKMENQTNQEKTDRVMGVIGTFIR